MNRNTRINALLLAAVAALAVLPLALGLGDDKEEPFTGSDAQAETAITENKPDYEPWFSPLYEPPSGEIESALFALQAALGGGVLAYYFGLRKGRRQGEARAAEAAKAAEMAGAAEAQAAKVPQAGTGGAAAEQAPAGMATERQVTGAESATAATVTAGAGTAGTETACTGTAGDETAGAGTVGTETAGGSGRRTA